MLIPHPRVSTETGPCCYQTDFLLQAHELIRARGRTPVVWNEGWEATGSRLGKDVVVQVWTAGEEETVSVTMKKVVQGGYQAVLAHKGTWYLSSMTTVWEDAWRTDPCADLTVAECKFVQGGGAAIWGEQVDASNLETRMWPRMAAVAEALWKGHGRREGLSVAYQLLNVSQQHQEDTARESFRARLHAFRCVLLARGIAALPVNIERGSSKATAMQSPREPASCGLL